ncbi:substrate-binding periplasmic protein [Candidatus Burkholderia verschuerenii]|uniref:substrate-binding periplasmic protein n=1 Tax=Candidatus Burkholderia verschuerenii TaxID=242163 RepID=UPI00067B5590|nr:transporter substrate-binding domain-containing protein [Candidatus Burkholderia verschuerenii]
MAKGGVVATHAGDWRAVCAAALLCIGVWAASRFDRDERPFAQAVARGVLVVAVPSRPAPTLNVGHVDRTVRAPDDYAAALAADIARQAGLPLRLILADTDAARTTIAGGGADIAIAGLPFAPDAAVAFAPTAYTSGRGIALVLRHGTVKDWRDLAGRSICAARGSPYAARGARRGHADVLSFDRPLDALLAFQAGDCAALIDDELVIRKLLKQADWGLGVLPHLARRCRGTTGIYRVGGRRYGERGVRRSHRARMAAAALARDRARRRGNAPRLRDVQRAERSVLSLTSVFGVLKRSS